MEEKLKCDMGKPFLVVADADAIVAQASPSDANHRKATEISRKLIQKNTQVLYPVTAVVEAVTVIQRVLSSGALAREIAVVFSKFGMGMVEIDQEIYSNAVDKYFSFRAGKKDTLFDCIVASVAEKYQADAVFSFDNFYKKKGFKLASEL